MDLVSCGTKDIRFVNRSGDKSIIIYNNKTYKTDLTIKEHSEWISCLTQ